MSTRTLVALLLAAGVAAYLWTHRAPSPPAAASGGSGWSPAECVRLGEQAEEAVREASLLLARPPFDGAAWSNARTRAEGAIAAAEACGAAAATDSDRRVWDPLRGALSSMRALLSELDGASKGGGSASPSSAVQLQEQVDAQMDRARAALKS